MMRPRATLIMVLALAAALAACTPLAAASGPNKMSYVVVPHPDDEIQAWSLIENSTGNYKVFIVLNRGEQSFYCGSQGYDEGTGEISPDPWPQGKWTPSCESARTNSFFGFMEAMARTDSALPASFTYAGVKGPFDSLGTEVCRFDDGDCVSDRTAEVWTSYIAAVVWFNLGDGDVTADEVRWAITTVRDNRTALGINDTLRNHNLIGAGYWNDTHPGCSDYAHADHGAVHEALWNTDFDVGYQAVPTCKSDPNVTRIEEVSYEHFHDAFEVSGNTRVGWHPVHYGWLMSGDPGYWRGDYESQDFEFHRTQHFWIRFR